MAKHCRMDPENSLVGPWVLRVVDSQDEVVAYGHLELMVRLTGAVSQADVRFSHQRQRIAIARTRFWTNGGAGPLTGDGDRLGVRFRSSIVMSGSFGGSFGRPFHN